MPSVQGRDVGVYAICNKNNGKKYVGSAAYGIKNRWWIHLCGLRKGTHRNRYLQNAWNKHGEKSFKLIVLELCDKSLCVEREQYWMDRYKSANPKFGYNRVPKAGSQLGLKHSDKTKALISKTGKGRRHREETKLQISKRMSVVMLGNTVWRGRQHTASARKKIAAAARKQWERARRCGHARLIAGV